MNPSVQVLHDSFDLMCVAQMPDREAESYLFNMIRRIADLERKAFALRGLVLLMVEERELWRIAGYPSMNRWVIEAAPWSHGACHEAMRAVEQLKDVPMVDLVEIPRCNLVQLQHLSTSVRIEPATLEAAKTLSEDAFAEHVQAKHPDQHIERPVKPTLRLTPPVVDALDAYGEAYPDIQERQAQLEGVMIDWLQERQ
jgi:hypothetical protein